LPIESTCCSAACVVHTQSYFEKLLTEASHALNESRPSSTRGLGASGSAAADGEGRSSLSLSTSGAAASGSSWVRRAASGLFLTPRRSFDAHMTAYNRAWVQLWAHTANFEQWQQHHPHPCAQDDLDRSFPVSH
jgi:hypothetical protein